jgi:hypothetical protein
MAAERRCTALLLHDAVFKLSYLDDFSDIDTST